MKTKIIPFDLETAKKIQAGEIEGRIVTNNGYSVRIICFDKRTSSGYPILGLIDYPNQSEMCKAFNVYGLCYGQPVEYILQIELPEETPQTFHTEFPKGHAVLHGNTIICVKEEASKHEFKEGDRVIINVDRCRPKLFFELYQNKVGTVRFTNNSGICVIVDDGKFQDIFIPSELKFLSQQNNNSDVSDRNYRVNGDYQFKIGDKVICYLDSIKMGEIVGRNTNGTFIVKNMLGGMFVAHADDMELHKPHEFKPFDKVLVRSSDELFWSCDLFSHIDNGTYVCIGGGWSQCIPYEGNEHLVGTTDKPKEE